MMNNTTILWSTFLLPWLTLLFIKKKELKRFLPVAWFTIVLNVVLYEFGLSFHLWNPSQAVYPFTSTPLFFFGAYPVTTIWIFQLSYSRFRLYLILNALADAIFAFLFIPWLTARGLGNNDLSNFIAIFAAAFSQAIVIYFYQVLQEQASSQNHSLVHTAVNPAQAKPLPQESEDKE